MRIASQVADLCANFDGSLDRFDGAELFTGPSLYFHQKAASRRLAIPDLAALLEDQEFFDSLYATLTAWGMHRMGPGNTKLLELGSIRASFRAQAAAIQALHEHHLGSGSGAEALPVARAVWRVLAALRVSPAEARIVANSKALHHVLPALVPPIDREYSFRFFYGRNNLSLDEPAAFEEMFVELDRIARTCSGEIQKRIGRGWHTGSAKVVDNAIVGYMISRKVTA